MEIKKSPKADLEDKKQMFFLMGCVLVLAVIFVGFEWATKDVTKYDNAGVSDATFEEEIVPVTTQPDVPPPPPPPPPAAIEELTIVDDSKDVKDVEIISTEDDSKKAQQVVVFTPPAVEEEDPAENQIFTIVEQKPEFPGGEAALLSWIGKNIKYPVVAAENGIQGRVVCKFVVNKDGKVGNVEVIRSVDPSLDKEAIRVLSQLPPFKPGMQRGKPVRVFYIVPVMFRLQ